MNEDIVYKAMIIAMILGRLVWAGAMVVLMGINGGVFTFEAFAAGAFLNAIPGIIAQLVLIPAVMAALGKTKLISFGNQEEA